MSAALSSSVRTATRLPIANNSMRYLVFRLGTAEYGVEILKVRELIALLDITRVPGSTHGVLGVVNLRGKVIPVIDLKLVLGMPKSTLVPHTVILVLEHGRDSGHAVGVVVDEVLDVVPIASEKIEPPPSIEGHAVASDSVFGVGKFEKRLIFLLNISKTLASSVPEHTS